MDILQIVVHWIHVLAGIIWFGGTLVVNLLVTPALNVLPPDQQRRLGRQLAGSLRRYYSAAAGVAMLFGILRGTLFGPIKGPDMLFGTAYGLTWLASLILTIGLAFIGSRYSAPTAERMYRDDSLWGFGPNEAPPAGLVAHVQLLRTIGLIELAGFFVVFTLMVFMRFGR